jgi:hypothetical protein
MTARTALAARTGRAVCSPLVLGLSVLVSACSSVDQILLTSDTFPPKESADQVAVLSRMPARAHRELAELRVGDTWFGFGTMQHKILDRAAALGADAVVFAKPDTQSVHHMAYEPAYDPWGYDSLYYGGLYGGWGPWTGPYPGSIAVLYDETVRMLMGTAIRYTDIARETGEPSSEQSRAPWGERWTLAKPAMKMEL